MVSSTQDVLPWHSAPVTAGGPQTALNKQEASAPGFHPFGEDGFSFLDLIDVINPLQHIPVIGPMYRDLTDDTIGPLPRIAGSTLFFGPLGAGLAAADVVLEETTGKDAGEHVLAMLRDQSGTQTAAAEVGAAGTDGPDPVDAWLQAEAAYRKQLVQQQGASPEPAATPAAIAADDAVETASVSTWAQAEVAYRAALATQPATETASRPRHVDNAGSRSMPSVEIAAAPPGAAAPGGGWFTDAMLNAWNRYETHQSDEGDASDTRRRRVN